MLAELARLAMLLLWAMLQQLWRLPGPALHPAGGSCCCCCCWSGLLLVIGLGVVLVLALMLAALAAARIAAGMLNRMPLPLQ